MEIVKNKFISKAGLKARFNIEKYQELNTRLKWIDEDKYSEIKDRLIKEYKALRAKLDSPEGIIAVAGDDIVRGAYLARKLYQLPKDIIESDVDRYHRALWWFRALTKKPDYDKDKATIKTLGEIIKKEIDSILKYLSDGEQIT